VRAANRAEGGLIIEIRLPLVETDVAPPAPEPIAAARV
jgi:hypothetical protein